jgi:hypothetical protein
MISVVSSRRETDSPDGRNPTPQSLGRGSWMVFLKRKARARQSAATAARLRQAYVA